MGDYKRRYIKESEIKELIEDFNGVPEKLETLAEYFDVKYKDVGTHDEVQKDLRKWAKAIRKIQAILKPGEGTEAQGGNRTTKKFKIGDKVTAKRNVHFGVSGPIFSEGDVAEILLNTDGNGYFVKILNGENKDWKIYGVTDDDIEKIEPHLEVDL